MVLARPTLIAALAAGSACAPTATFDLAYPLAPGEAATQLVAVETPGAELRATVAPYGTPIRVELDGDARAVVELLAYSASIEDLKLVEGPVAFSAAADARPIPTPSSSWRVELDANGDGERWARTSALGEALVGKRLPPSGPCSGLDDRVQTRIVGADAALVAWAIDDATVGLLTQNLRLWRVRRAGWESSGPLVATSTSALSVRSAARARDGTFVLTSPGVLWRTTGTETSTLVALARDPALQSGAALAIDPDDPDAEAWVVGSGGGFSRVSRGRVERVHTFSSAPDITFVSVARAGPGHAAAAVDGSPEVVEVRDGVTTIGEPFGPNEGVMYLGRWGEGWLAGSTTSRVALRGDADRTWRIVGTIPNSVTLGAVLPIDARRVLYGGDYGFVGIFSLDEACPSRSQPIHDRRVTTFVRVGEHVAISGRSLPGRTNVVTWISAP